MQNQILFSHEYNRGNFVTGHVLGEFRAHYAKYSKINTWSDVYKT